MSTTVQHCICTGLPFDPPTPSFIIYMYVCMYVSCMYVCTYVHTCISFLCTKNYSTYKETIPLYKETVSYCFFVRTISLYKETIRMYPLYKEMVYRFFVQMNGTLFLHTKKRYIHTISSVLFLRYCFFVHTVSSKKRYVRIVP